MSGNLGREISEAKRLLEALAEDIGDDEDVKASVVEGETSLFEAVDMALEEVLKANMMIDGIDDVIQRLKHRRDRIDQRAGRIQQQIMMAMDAVGTKKMERPIATLSLRNVPGKVQIVSEEDIPSAYLVEETKVRPDKKAILEALKAGETVPGAEMSNGGQTIAVRWV